MSLAPPKFVVSFTICVLLIFGPVCEAKRFGSGNSKSGGGYSTRRQPSTSVTKPTYNTNSGSSASNSHIDAAKLSYPNYNSPPNRPASAPSSNGQNIGWNVPNQSPAGPPPAYSASNIAGGAKTNIHEPPPAYQKPNYAAPPPNYNQATGTNYGAAPSYHGSQSIPAGATYHSANNLPPGATYYNNPSQLPGGYPGGASYPAGGYGAGGYHGAAGIPAGATYYPSSQSLPQGATYLPAGNALPPGAVLYSSPPQQTSSGLGFGSGLAAGALGGAILGHVLTPTQTRVIEQAPAAASGGGSEGPHVIIINNGQPVNATDGVTVINSGVAAVPANSTTNTESETPAPLAPIAPVPADAAQNTTNADAAAVTASPPLSPPAENSNPPPSGGIICVPVRINETDPNDASKMVEVEKIACYPAPPPPQTQDDMAMVNNNTVPMSPANEAPITAGSAPLAPMQPLTPGASSQQLQQESTMIGDQSMKSVENAAFKETGSLAIIFCFVLSHLINSN